MTIEITPQQAKGRIAAHVRAGLVTFLKGPPGTAKSAIVQEIADEYNLKLIDLRLAQCDVTDLLGFPYIDKERMRARYVPMETFPLETDPLPVDANGKQMSGWLLFLDEFNSADRDIQKGAYKLIHEKVIGNVPLHKKVAIVAAGNREIDGAIVEEMSSALRSRLIHLNIRPDNKDWLAWARNVGIDVRITSFIEWKPNRLYTFDPAAGDAQETYACYRTWDYTNRLISGITDLTKEPDLLPSLAGTLSEGVAREFLAYLKNFSNLPKLSQIIANPEGIPLPKEPGTQYAITGAIGANANDQNIDPLMRFVERLPVEFQIITLREVVRRQPALMQAPRVQAWQRANAKELI